MLISLILLFMPLFQTEARLLEESFLETLQWNLSCENLEIARTVLWHYVCQHIFLIYWASNLNYAYTYSWSISTFPRRAKLSYTFVSGHFSRKGTLLHLADAQIYHARNFNKEHFQYRVTSEKSAADIIIKHAWHTIEFQKEAFIFQWPQNKLPTSLRSCASSTFTQLMAPLHEARGKYFADI